VLPRTRNRERQTRNTRRQAYKWLTAVAVPCGSRYPHSTQPCFAGHKDLRELSRRPQPCAPFRYSFGKYLIADNDQNVAASLEYGGSADGKIGEDALRLDKDASGKVRLLYEVCEWEGCVEVDGPGGPFFWNDETLKRDVRPLIETKFETRKRVYNHHLRSFVIALAKHYAIDPSKLTDPDELPF
jgi:hypothetical protein